MFILNGGYKIMRLQVKYTKVIILLSLILLIGWQSLSAEKIQTIKKELPAIKTEQPPTIDGILNDDCWNDAPTALGFTDQRTEQPAKNQTVGRIIYNENSIYIGLHLYDDKPKQIVARQVKDQTRITGEDWVSFSIDPYHTHQFSDRNFFIVNPLGTKFAHLATGRAEKSEWIGLWKAAAQIVDDGWIVEMEIPWQILDYPETVIPIRMGINLDRFQQRTGERSWWCNLGVQEFRENDGHWIDVLPPPRKRDLKFLPYLIGGISEDENQMNGTSESQTEYTARIGGDLRLEVTPQLRLITTANPDFDNIEQSVEGIDFSYSERYVEDRRPFFSEGGNVYHLGNLFYSRRIMDMDGGIKLYGKVAKNTSIGTLGTYHRNNQNLIFRAKQSFTATSHIIAGFLSHHQPDKDMNNVGHLSGSIRKGKFSGDSSITQSWQMESDGRTGNLNLRYNGSLFQSTIFGYFVDPDFVNHLGYRPFTGIRGGGVEGLISNEWRKGIIRSIFIGANVISSDTYEGELFQQDYSVFSNFYTHSDYGLSVNWFGGQFQEFTDSILSIRMSARSSDQFNNVSIGYNWGEQADERLQRISGNLNLRFYGFTVGLTSSIQWHFERRYQQILTLSYDFSPAISLGSRLIWQIEGINYYFALRRSGYAGTNYFIILGDPNAIEFKKRIIAKVIQAF